MVRFRIWDSATICCVDTLNYSLWFRPSVVLTRLRFIATIWVSTYRMICYLIVCGNRVKISRFKVRTSRVIRCCSEAIYIYIYMHGEVAFVEY